MKCRCINGKINVKVLVILLLVTLGLTLSLVIARQVRRGILSQRDLDAGRTAFNEQDWSRAAEYLREYLGRNPDDVEVLREYGYAVMAIRPLTSKTVAGAISAFRRVRQLDPNDFEAYAALVRLYRGIGNFEELAYMSRMRLESEPNDVEDSLILAEAMLGLDRTSEAKSLLEKLFQVIRDEDSKNTYTRICVKMSEVLQQESFSDDSESEAVLWLNRALDRDPNCVDALVHRASLYREIYGTRSEIDLGRKDLEKASALCVDNARLCLMMGIEWIALGEMDRAEEQLRVAETLPDSKVEEEYLDLKDWEVARFLLGGEVVLRRGDRDRAVAMAGQIMQSLKEPRHRIRVMPTVILLYVIAEQIPEARASLSEYMELALLPVGRREPEQRLVHLKALVAKAEGDAYTVIDVLRPAVIEDDSKPEFWRMLAEAFQLTDQPRQAINAYNHYLRLRPSDPEALIQLTKTYLKLRDWNRAYETARLAEPLVSEDPTVRILRLEASTYQAVEDTQINVAHLETLSDELEVIQSNNPKRVDVRVLQAIIDDYLQRPMEAEIKLKKAIEQCEDSLRAEMQLVSHYYQLGRKDKALHVCRSICDRQGQASEPWITLFGLYMALADPDSARDCLEEGAGKVTDAWDQRSIMIQLAVHELTDGDRQTGINLLQKIAERDKRDVRVRTLLLGVKEVQSRPAQAQQLIDELRNAEGSSGLFWRLYQAILWMSSDSWRLKQQDIRDYLKYCIDIDPKWEAPVLILAEMYDKLDDPSREEDLCRQALVRNPSATQVLNRLMTGLEKQGRLTEAIQVLQQSEEEDHIVSSWRVRTALRGGNLSYAINELKVRISNDDRDEQSRILLARLIYLQNRDVDLALSYLQEAEDITGKSLALISTKISILRAEGKMEEASALLDRYVSDQSTFNAHVLRAVFLAREGKLAKAEEDYHKLLEFESEGSLGYRILGKFYQSHDRLEEAVSLLEDATRKYPEDREAKRLLMKMLIRRNEDGDQDRANVILTELEATQGQDPDLMRVRAMQWLRENTPSSIQAARNTLEDVVKIEPTAVDAQLALIGISLYQGDIETARDKAIRALGSNPNNPSLLAARSTAELMLQNNEMAVELVNMALREDPNNKHVQNVLTTVALATGDSNLLEKALDRVDEKSQTNEESEPLIILRSRLLVGLGQIQLAQRKLLDYCQSDAGKESLPALQVLGELQLQVGDFDAVTQVLSRAESIDPNGGFMPDVRLHLASALYQIHRIDEAKQYYKSLLDKKEYRDNLRVLNDMAWILQENDANFNQALVLATRGLVKDPNNPYLLDTRATILTKMEGKLGEARKDYEKLVKVLMEDGPAKAKALMKLGEVCYKLEDETKAQSYLRAALTIDADEKIFSEDERQEIHKILFK